MVVKQSDYMAKSHTPVHHLLTWNGMRDTSDHDEDDYIVIKFNHQHQHPIYKWW